jgi:hypothetical protein
VKSSCHTLIPFLPFLLSHLRLPSPKLDQILDYNWLFYSTTCLSLSLMLEPTVSWPVCLWIKQPSGSYDQIFITVKQLRGFWCGGALSEERTSLSFIIAAGARQRSHSLVRVLWDSWPYFTVSDSRLPFSSPPMIRRATVEKLDPASTQKWTGTNVKVKVKVKVKVTLRLTVSRPVCLGRRQPSGAQGQIFITVWQTKACWCGCYSYSCCAEYFL